jgi:hypothetical protein
MLFRPQPSLTFVLSHRSFSNEFISFLNFSFTIVTIKYIKAAKSIFNVPSEKLSLRPLAAEADQISRMLMFFFWFYLCLFIYFYICHPLFFQIYLSGFCIFSILT